MSAADEFRQTFTGLGVAIAEVVEERDRLRERLEIDPGGSDAIDVADSVISQLRSEIERLKNLLCLADEALMLSHGCFPLDRTGRRERYLSSAAKAIRAVTGEDFHERKRLAALALERPE